MGHHLKNYVSIGLQYAVDVTSGKILAGEFVKSACQRQIDDLENPPEGFEFNVAQANRVCTVMEQFPHIKGKWAKQKLLITLEPWQCFILTTIFGWVNEFGIRRFKTVYIEVPRKNAKSTLSAGIGLYMLACDKEEGAECYAAATTYDQAKIVFGVAQHMARKCNDFCNSMGVAVNAGNINQLSSASKFEALSSEGSSLDGLNVSFACIDELHAHKTRVVYDVLETATGSREQSLIWNITTAGTNRAGVCYEQRVYVTKILKKVFEDDTYFGIIYSIDKDDDWKSEKALIKANPNWGVSVNPEDLLRKQKKAIELASAQNNFKTKHLDVWANAGNAWMNMVKWDLCADDKLSIEQFKGERCYVGIDLASKIDIAALMFLFEKEINGLKHYYLFGRYYLPEETIDGNVNSQYEGWTKDGLLTATDGNVIDFERIEEDLIDAKKNYDIEEVAFDPFQATQFSLRMEKAGFNMIQYGATVKNFSEPMKELEGLVIDERIHHTGDPILAWMVSNVICHTDAKDNIFPRKELPQNKIDGVVAGIMSLGICTLSEEEPKPYKKRGIIQL